MSEPEQLDLLDWLAAQPRCLAPSADPVLLTRMDPSCNMRRFYSMVLATSLFGECGVVRQWGRIGTSGHTRTDWYGEPPEAAAALKALLQAKQRRGYKA